MFFIISGIVIPISLIKRGFHIRQISAYILRRLARLEPPYLISILLFLVYFTIRSNVSWTNPIDLMPSLRDVVLHLGYLIPFFEDSDWIAIVYWTLAVEFQYYLFLAFLFPLLNSFNIANRSLFYFICLIPPFLDVSTAHFPFWAHYFLIGIIFGLYYLRRIGTLEYIIVTALCLTTSLLFQKISSSVISLIVISTCFLWPRNSMVVTKYLGKISYSIYLLHTLIGAGTMNFLVKTTNLPKVVIVFAGVVSTLISADIYYRIIEYPSIRFSKKF